MSEQAWHSREQRISADALKQWSADVFTASGMRRDDAELGAQVLLRTSLRGIDTHGIACIPANPEMLRSGEVDSLAQPFPERRRD